MEEQQHAPTFTQKAKRFYGECIRVLTVTKKPDRLEYTTIVKVSGLGILLVGVIGFVITIIQQLFFK